jgi:hypothetical protein
MINNPYKMVATKIQFKPITFVRYLVGWRREWGRVGRDCASPGIPGAKFISTRAGNIRAKIMTLPLNISTPYC